MCSIAAAVIGWLSFLVCIVVEQSMVGGGEYVHSVELHGFRHFNISCVVCSLLTSNSQYIDVR